MPGHDIIVIGGSAGALEPLRELAAKLSSDFAAAVFVVLHIAEDYASVLARILNRAGPLPALEATDGDTIRPGRIYVACPGNHLVLGKGHIHVVRGARENGVRPAIDPLFRSAAWAYGPRVIGVVLSGNLDDGTAGLLAIKRRGGVAVVQDPQDALFASMPTSAVENVPVDYAVPVSEMAPLLLRLVEEPAEDESKYPVPKRVEIEAQIALKGAGTMEQVSQWGELSSFTCPECQGALWQVVDEGLIRYRCQTGHAFSIDSLQDGQMHAVEGAMWAALRALEEQSELCHRVALNGRQHNHLAVANAFEKKAKRAEQHAAALRRLLEENGADQQEEPLPHTASGPPEAKAL